MVNFPHVLELNWSYPYRPPDLLRTPPQARCGACGSDGAPARRARAKRPWREGPQRAARPRSAPS